MKASVVRFAAAAARNHHKVLVVGGGSGGLGVANQIYNRFKADGKALAPGDVAIVDGAEFHNYQPGWTLVGAGLKNKHSLQRRMADLIPSHIAHKPEHVASFSPESNSITTVSGASITYDTLVVAGGIQVNWDNIPGLSKALADPTSGVSSIYGFDTCDKAWSDIEALKSGKAIFTQPAGVIKCPGAPQKIMWMAWDRFRRTGRGDNIKVEFLTGMPTMFSVPKYSQALNTLREERGIAGSFTHNLTSIDAAKRIATFTTSDGKKVDKEYDLLHVAPQMGPPNFIKASPLADAAGWVDVDPASMQHKKFANVFALGDSSNVPTAKTAAAITAQSPVLTHNLATYLQTGKVGNAVYTGYASCPLLTGYGELMLAEFVYGFKPNESFAKYGFNQAIPRTIFYHLKKDFFPWVYFYSMVKGTWFGTKGFTSPQFSS